MEAYQSLEKEFARLSRLQHLQALGSWDMDVNMPPKGSEGRGEAMALLAELQHQWITAPQLAAWLEACEAPAAAAALTEAQRANVREMRRLWRSENLLSEEFVSRKSKLTTRANQVWRDARAANDFAHFLPVLKELVEVAREEGRTLAGDSGKQPYDALLDLYDPGLTMARLDDVFGNVKSWLPQLIQDIRAKQAAAGAAVPLRGPFPAAQQEALAKDLMRMWQFDFEAGRLDVSTHPFTGGTKTDTRITTRYEEDNLPMSLFAVIHETGHAKYEQNCGPREMLDQPVCNARSMTVHESQSLFQERMVGHSDAFLDVLTPLLVKHFGAQEAFSSVENVKKILNHVEPGFIRVKADEVCYPMHIILRYEMERDLISGALEAEEVPKVWNAKMKEYLGLDVGDRDDLGCLQDIHWSMGAFGYFPTYSLGAMFAAQLMATIRKELGDAAVDEAIRTQALGPIFAKQHEKIWSNGCLYESDELMTRATGEALNPQHFHDHLVKRYLQ